MRLKIQILFCLTACFMGGCQPRDAQGFALPESFMQIKRQHLHRGFQQAQGPVTEPVTEPVLSGNAFGIPMAGMTRDEALKALQDAAASYVLTLNVNTYDVPITAQDLNLKVSEAAFDRWFADLLLQRINVLL